MVLEKHHYDHGRTWGQKLRTNVQKLVLGVKLGNSGQKLSTVLQKLVFGVKH